METFDKELLPGLPNEVALLCIARVCRSAFGVLRVVNRAWRGLLSSSFFFDYRKSEGLSEAWLYIMLRNQKGQTQWKVFKVPEREWFTLPYTPRVMGAACTVVDSKLYMVGGSSNTSVATKKVSVYDPCFNKWSEVAHMRVPREFAAAGAIGGKMYVIGGCLGSWAGSSAWAEVFDPKSGKWDVFPTPADSMRERWMHGSAVLDGKLFAVADSGGLVLDPSAKHLNAVSNALNDSWRGKAAVVNEKLFSWNYMDKIMGYDLQTDSWRSLEVEGKQLPKLEWGVNLASVAGKLLVIGEHPPKGGLSVLDFSAIEIEDNGEGEKLRGRVIWSHVFTLDVKVTNIINCLCIEL